MKRTLKKPRRIAGKKRHLERKSPLTISGRIKKTIITKRKNTDAVRKLNRRAELLNKKFRDLHDKIFGGNLSSEEKKILEEKLKILRGKIFKVYGKINKLGGFIEKDIRFAAGLSQKPLNRQRIK